MPIIIMKLVAERAAMSGGQDKPAHTGKTLTGGLFERCSR